MVCVDITCSLLEVAGECQTKSNVEIRTNAYVAATNAEFFYAVGTYVSADSAPLPNPMPSNLFARQSMTHEIGQIFRIQFFHDASAMDFDCPCRDAQLVPDNFVLMTLDEKTEYFFFPVGKCLPWFLLGIVRCGRAQECSFQCAQHNRLLERLFEKLDCTVLHGLTSHRYVSVTCHYDDWQFRHRAPDLALKLKSVHLRHANVDERTRVLGADSRCQKSAGRFKCQSSVLPMKQQDNRFAHINVIIDDIDRAV